MPPNSPNQHIKRESVPPNDQHPYYQRPPAHPTGDTIEPAKTQTLLNVLRTTTLAEEKDAMAERAEAQASQHAAKVRRQRLLRETAETRARVEEIEAKGKVYEDIARQYRAKAKAERTKMVRMLLDGYGSASA